MRTARLATLSLLGALLAAAACGDDDRDRLEGDASDPATGDQGGDGGVSPGDPDDPDDPGSSDLDGGTPGMDATAPDGASDPTLPADGGPADGGPVDGGAITPPDGGLDAGQDMGQDAGEQDAGSSPDASACEVDDPLFGCGVVRNGDWVVFESGVEVDRVNKKAWSPAMDVVSDTDLIEKCGPLVLADYRYWRIPQLEEVRTSFAAGCEKTLPGGSCQVYADMVTSSDAGDCTCSGGVGPNDGKFCRPEVEDCSVIWVWTHTEEQGMHEHWYYDVATGSIVKSPLGVGISATARGRCVQDLEVVP